MTEVSFEVYRTYHGRVTLEGRLFVLFGWFQSDLSARHSMFDEALDQCSEEYRGMVNTTRSIYYRLRELLVLNLCYTAWQGARVMEDTPLADLVKPTDIHPGVVSTETFDTWYAEYGEDLKDRLNAHMTEKLEADDVGYVHDDEEVLEIASWWDDKNMLEIATYSKSHDKYTTWLGTMQPNGAVTHLYRPHMLERPCWKNTNGVRYPTVMQVIQDDCLACVREWDSDHPRAY